ncbi:MAG: DJ-1/PfpI family protein [Ignavibacteria bacterium]|nr:DJ-1/PfpI family protein [Ignavibacteria bacterium]
MPSPRHFFVMLVLAAYPMLTTAQQPPAPQNVAILIYDGVYLLDFTGPMEIFSDVQTGDTARVFNVYTVGPTANAIRCHTGLRCTPAYSIADSPQPDILVVPGGERDLATTHPAVGEWIRSAAAKAHIVMSVCTGAFILAELGMLDGLEATTWYGAAGNLRKRYPAIRVCEGRRFTDNGKVITTAGISAGIDGALHVVERLLGKETAERTAKFVEYAGPTK